jgi:Winged helix-turn helix
VVCAAQRTAATPPLAGADPAPRWTLRRLVGWVRERFGLVCCRETIRAVLHRRKLSWKKAKKLLGRADPERRQAFIEQLQGVLEGAQRDRHLVVYVDEAHVHQDADLGYGWAKRGERFWVASSSPGLSARVSFYGLYLYNEGQVRLWPFAAVAFPARQRRPHDRGAASAAGRVPR